MNKMNQIDNIIKNLPNKINEDDRKIDIETPMIQTTTQYNKTAERANVDSTCTRFVRKKFVCIIIFLMAIIAIMNFFGAVTEKLSQENVQQIYRGMAHIFHKFNHMYQNNTLNTMNTLHFIPEIYYNASNK